MKSRLLQVSIGNQLLFASKEQKLQQTRVREGQDNLKMSLLATSYRFEIQTGNAKAHKKAMERQEAFIKDLEEQSARSKEEAADKRANEMSKWIEKFEEAGERKKIGRELKEIGEELKFAGKGLVMVRQARLKELLDGEQRQYEDELASLGKAFYVERI